MKFYSLDRILKEQAQYNVIIGERSNGKTYAVLKHIMEEYFNGGKKFAYVRRWEEDIRGMRLETVFEGLNRDKVIEKLSGGDWQGITTFRRCFYLYREVENAKGEIRKEKSIDPIGYAYALTNMEHDKGESDSAICNILFDECLTRRMYLPDEFVIFCNLLSTIIRLRDNVKIFMVGNTVNKFSPYFKEMGLTGISKLERGKIQLYTYGDSELRVAVEFADTVSKLKPSNKYFAFNNPKLQMITGATGNVWEMNIYPHLPEKYVPKDIIFTFFILFEGSTLQCEIISKNEKTFVYIHEKTTPLKNPDEDLIYCLDYDPRPNWRMNIKKPYYPVEKKIALLFQTGKVFYQDNETGEKIRNFLNLCGKEVIRQ